MRHPIKPCLLLTALLPFMTLQSRCGELDQFFYLTPENTTLEDFTSGGDFPGNPFTSTPVRLFHDTLQGIPDAGDLYGSWMRGFLEAPETGEYTFYGSANTVARFYLSTNHSASNKVLLLDLQQPSTRLEYGEHPEQVSGVRRLEKGRQYYFEILHLHQGTTILSSGEDHVSLGWLRPGGQLERPVPLRYVQRFVPESGSGPGITNLLVQPPVFPGGTGDRQIPAQENERVVLETAWEAVPPVSAQWYEAGSPIPGATFSWLDLGQVDETDDGRSFELRISTPEGDAVSPVHRLHVNDDTTPPSIVRAASKGNPKGFNLTFSEPVDPATATNIAHYTLNQDATVERIEMLYGTNWMEVVVFTSPLTNASPYEVTVTDVADLAEPPNLLVSETSPIDRADGKITAHYFGNVPGAIGYGPISGDSILHLMNHTNRFPDNPDLETFHDQFESFHNVGDDYGARLVGYLTPPVSGEYQFMMSSDNQGILYLSTDESPANKRAIAGEPQWNGYRNYSGEDRRTFNSWFASEEKSWIAENFPNRSGDDVPVNDSLNAYGTIELQQNHRYYVEALLKTAGGADHLTVAWRKPGDPPVEDGDDPIPGEHLSLFSSGGSSGPVQITMHPYSPAILETQSFQLSVLHLGSPPYQYQWFRNGEPVVDATDRIYERPFASLMDNGAEFRVRVRNDFSEAWSEPLTMEIIPDTTPPSVTRIAADEDFDKVIIDFDEPILGGEAARLSNYAIRETVSGELLEIHSIETLLPENGGYRQVVLHTDTIGEGVSYTVSPENLTDVSMAANELAVEEPLTFTGWVMSRGFVKFERYLGIAGSPIAELRASEKFPDDPDMVTYLTSWEAPRDIHENFGGRISGQVFPELEGHHTFYLAAEDTGELWLSSDSSPENLALIASSAVWNAYRNWDHRDSTVESNISGAIVLENGKAYHMEALYKETIHGDHLSVTWQRPGDPMPANGTPSVLTGNAIGIYASPDGTQIEFTSNPRDTNIVEGESVELSLTVAAQLEGDSNPPILYQWQLNGTDIPGANASKLQIGPVLPPDDGSRYRCIVSIPGKTTASEEATLTVTPIPPLEVIRVSGSSTHDRVFVYFSGEVDPTTGTSISNYSIQGLDIFEARVSETDPTVVELTTTMQIPGTGYDYTIEGIENTATSPTALPQVSGNFTAWTLEPGWVKREFYTDISGAEVSNLTNASKFPDRPDMVNHAPAWEWNHPDTLYPWESHKVNYGARVSGWLQVTNTGDYVFAISSDDQSMLYISSDDSPDNKQLIAVEPQWNGFRNFDSESNNRSSRIGGNSWFPTVTGAPINYSMNTVGPIRLEQSNRYYLEALHKQSTHGDNLAVAMYAASQERTSDGTPGIRGDRIWNYVNPDNQIHFTQQPENREVESGGFVDFSVEASADDGPVMYQWQRDGVDLPGRTSPTLSVGQVRLADSGSVFRVRMTAPGVTAYSDEALLTVPMPPLQLWSTPSQPSSRLIWEEGDPRAVLQSTETLGPEGSWQNETWDDQWTGYSDKLIELERPRKFFRVILEE